MSNATIKDVARISGVSLATVSRVINKTGYVSPELSEKVLSAIRSTGYHPNQAARALVQRRTDSIGVIVHNLHDPFFCDLIRGFEDAAAETSYNVIFASVVGGNLQSKEKYLRYLSGGVVDAVVIYGSYMSDEDMIRYVSSSANIDYLLIENDIRDLQCNKLLINNLQGACSAVDYLIGKGHSDIAHICGNPNKKITIDRLSGYLETMRSRGLEVKEGYLQHTSSDYRSGYARMQDLLKLPNRPSAVFCSDDAIASFAVRAALDAGLRVPQDISIMGFDHQVNLPERYRGPDITTVKQPLYEIGFDSISILSRHLKAGTEHSPERKEYDTQIIEQETVCPPSR